MGGVTQTNRLVGVAIKEGTRKMEKSFGIKMNTCNKKKFSCESNIRYYSSLFYASECLIVRKQMEIEILERRILKRYWKRDGWRTGLDNGETKHSIKEKP